MVKLLWFLIFASLFITGCNQPRANISHQQNFANSNQNIQKKNHQKPIQTKTAKRDKFKLLVISEPENSRVRIMNIKPKYHDNIALKKGRYLIEVSKKGYQTYKKWIKIEDDTTLHVKLKKATLPSINYSGEVIWKESEVEDKFKKYSLYTLMDSLKSSLDNNRLLWLDDKISKAKGISWIRANAYCKNLKLHGLKWRLPTCQEAKKYNKEMEKYLLYHTYVSTWVNKKNFLSYSGCSLKKDGDPYYWQFECVADTNPKVEKYSVASIASLIAKDFKGIKKKTAFNKALNIKYGNPKITNIKYSSKTQTLSFDLVSSRINDIGLKKGKAKLKNAITAKNSSRVKENIQVYNLKNESIIVVDTSYVSRSYFKAFDLSKIKNLQHLIYKDYIFDDSLHYASFLIETSQYRPRKKNRIFIVVDRITSDRYTLGNFLRIPDNSSGYARGEVELQIDPNIKVDREHKRKYRFKKRVELKVSPKYIKDMINLITSESFKPTVVFEVKDGDMRFKGIKELDSKNTFVEKGEYEKADFDISALREFIKKYPNSKYSASANKRIKEIKELYKGYEPKEIFKVEGCVGYLPINLITKNINKIKIKPSSIRASLFGKITWSGLCRRGLLSGRGYMRMVSKDGNFIVGIEGKMRDGFFVGEVERDIKKITKRMSKTTYRYIHDKIKEDIKLETYRDYVNYQKENR